MPKITNVRWGLDKDPDDPDHIGQPCLYFDVDGRPASAGWEQTGVMDRGILFIEFEDGKPSHLPTIEVRDGERLITSSDQFVHSPWLIERMREMLNAYTFEGSAGDPSGPRDAPEGE
jgi:hypothetical protein